MAKQRDLDVTSDRQYLIFKGIVAVSSGIQFERKICYRDVWYCNILWAFENRAFLCVAERERK
jgi:hypothetical protein